MLKQRVRGIRPKISAKERAWTNLYNLAYPERLNPQYGGAGAYDIAYLFAYAALASGKKPGEQIKGADIYASSLNVHVHLHTCALDGVYVEEEDATRFVPAPAPSRAELYALTERVALRVMTWLRKRGHAKDDEHASNDAPERSFAETLAQPRWAHLLPREEVGPAHVTLPNHDARRVHREALCSRAASSLPPHALPWRARPARQAPASHRAEGAAQCHATVLLVAPDSQGTEGHAGQDGRASTTSRSRRRRHSDRARRGGHHARARPRRRRGPRAEHPLCQAPQPHRRRTSLRGKLECALGHLARPNLRGGRQVLRPLRRQA